MSQSDEHEVLSFREKLGYGLGDTASNFYLSFFGLFLLYYYTDVFGLAPAAVATMLLVTKIIDAISDPLMGLIADRTSSRWGRYRPYLLWMAIPYGLCGYAMFLGPELSTPLKLLYAYASYIIVMLAYTAINVPYSALLGVISPSSIERTKVTTFRFFCATAGGLLIGALATPLKNRLGGGDEALGFQLTMAVFAVASVLLFWISFATTKERIQPQRRTSRVKDDLGALLQNRSWLVLVITGILLITGLLMRIASVPFYFKYIVLDDGQPVFLIFDQTALFLTLGPVAQLVGVLCTQWLTARFEKHHLIMALSFIHAVALLAFFWVPPDDLWLMIAIQCLTLWTFGPSITLLFAMYTDCAEYGEWKTGKRTTALIVSASMFSLKFGSAIGGALPGFVLAGFGFVSNAVQTDWALTGIRLTFSIFPAICFVLCGVIAFFYQLDRKAMRRIEDDLHERRRQRDAEVAAEAGS